MLLELAVDNIVIVSRARLRIGPGLTVISGETGAGKTLLLDALGLLLGSRSSTACLGPEGEEAVVSGVFAVPVDLRAEMAGELGLDLDGEEVVLRRRLRANGRSRAWIDDQPVSVTGLRSCGERLVEMRLQDESLRLREPAYQLEMIDRYGGHGDLAAAYRQAHADCLAGEAELERLEQGERGSVKELTHLRYLHEELVALAPEEGEYEALRQRQELLASAREWQALAARAADGLIDGEHAVTPWVDGLQRELAEAPSAPLRQAAECLTEAAEALREGGRLVAGAVDEIDCDESALARVEERLGQWYDLMRKHGGSERALFETWAGIEERIEELEGLDDRRASCAEGLAESRRRREATGRELAAARRRAAAELIAGLRDDLAALGMGRASLELHESEEARPGPDGLIRQELWVCTNPGLEPGPLGAVPSGGESSRLALALAGALAACNRVGTMVFDEVDSGVGGRLGGAIAERLLALARDRAVLAITHSPQIAARADRHYLLRKHQDDARTSVSVEEIAGDERRRELAEMLGGGDAALHQAVALLGEGHQ